VELDDTISTTRDDGKAPMALVIIGIDTAEHTRGSHASAPGDGVFIRWEERGMATPVWTGRRFYQRSRSEEVRARGGELHAERDREQAVSRSPVLPCSFL